MCRDGVRGLTPFQAAFRGSPVSAAGRGAQWRGGDDRRGPGGRRARVVAGDCDYFRVYSIVIIFISFLAPGGVPYISKV
jgi:hypothetical protein